MHLTHTLEIKLGFLNFYMYIFCRWGDVTLITGSDGVKYQGLYQRQIKIHTRENIADVRDVIQDILMYRRSQPSRLHDLVWFIRQTLVKGSFPVKSKRLRIKLVSRNENQLTNSR